MDYLESFFEPFRYNYEEKLYDSLSKVLSENDHGDVFFFNSYSYLVIKSLIKTELLRKKFRSESKKDKGKRKFILVYFSGGGSKGVRVFDRDSEIVENSLSDMRKESTYLDICSIFANRFLEAYGETQRYNVADEAAKRLLLTPLFEEDENDDTKYSEFRFYPVSMDYSLSNCTNKVEVAQRMSVPILFNLITVLKDHERNYRLFVSPDLRAGDMGNVKFILRNMLKVSEWSIVEVEMKLKDYEMRDVPQNATAGHCLDILECNEFGRSELVERFVVNRLYPSEERYNGLLRLALRGTSDPRDNIFAYADNFGGVMNLADKMDRILRHLSSSCDGYCVLKEPHPVLRKLDPPLKKLFGENEEVNSDSCHSVVSPDIFILVSGPLDLYGVYLIYDMFKSFRGRVYLFASCVLRSLVKVLYKGNYEG